MTELASSIQRFFGLVKAHQELKGRMSSLPPEVQGIYAESVGRAEGEMLKMLEPLTPAVLGLKDFFEPLEEHAVKMGLMTEEELHRAAADFVAANPDLVEAVELMRIAPPIPTILATHLPHILGRYGLLEAQPEEMPLPHPEPEKKIIYPLTAREKLPKKEAGREYRDVLVWTEGEGEELEWHIEALPKDHTRTPQEVMSLIQEQFEILEVIARHKIRKDLNTKVSGRDLNQALFGRALSNNESARQSVRIRELYKKFNDLGEGILKREPSGRRHQGDYYWIGDRVVIHGFQEQTPRREPTPPKEEDAPFDVLVERLERNGKDIWHLELLPQNHSHPKKGTVSLTELELRELEVLGERKARGEAHIAGGDFTREVNEGGERYNVDRIREERKSLFEKINQGRGPILEKSEASRGPGVWYGAADNVEFRGFGFQKESPPFVQDSGEPDNSITAGRVRRHHTIVKRRRRVSSAGSAAGPSAEAAEDVITSVVPFTLERGEFTPKTVEAQPAPEPEHPQKEDPPANPAATDENRQQTHSLLEPRFTIATNGVERKIGEMAREIFDEVRTESDRHFSESELKRKMELLFPECDENLFREALRQVRTLPMIYGRTERDQKRTVALDKNMGFEIMDENNNTVTQRASPEIATPKSRSAMIAAGRAGQKKEEERASNDEVTEEEVRAGAVKVYLYPDMIIRGEEIIEFIGGDKRLADILNRTGGIISIDELANQLFGDAALSDIDRAGVRQFVEERIEKWGADVLDIRVSNGREYLHLLQSFVKPQQDS